MAYHRFPMLSCLTAWSIMAMACGQDPSHDGDDAPDATPKGIRFAERGPLSAPSGRGQFRFGAASAATQIEDQNASTDW